MRPWLAFFSIAVQHAIMGTVAASTEGVVGMTVVERARLREASTLLDGEAAVEVGAPRLLADAFRPYEAYDVVVTRSGVTPLPIKREVVRSGRVVGVICVDPDRATAVFIRQFRLAAHIATGRGAMIEVVAGRVEGDEPVSEAARRECEEEIGVSPTALVHLFDFMPAPGMTDEFASMFLAAVDSTAVPALSGSPHENEVTEPLLVALDATADIGASGGVYNSFLLLALNWLALNRDRIRPLLADPAAAVGAAS